MEDNNNFWLKQYCDSDDCQMNEHSMKCPHCPSGLKTIKIKYENSKYQKKDIIKSFQDAFGIPYGEIVLHKYPKWSFYLNKITAHEKHIEVIHSFEFNAIEQRIIYNYLKGNL